MNLWEIAEEIERTFAQAVDGNRGGVLRAYALGELGVVEMKVYDRQGLQALMGIGKDTAYRIMKEYGFRTGYTDKSPLRITEDGLKEYIRKEKSR